MPITIVFLNYLNLFFSDPVCDAYDCQEVTHWDVDHCVVYWKEPEDIDCHLPCLLKNCTVGVYERHICVSYECTPHPGPTPPPPPPPSPTPPPSPPIPHPHFFYGFAAGSCVSMTLFCIIVAILVRNSRRRRRRIEREPLIDRAGSRGGSLRNQNIIIDRGE